MFANIPGKSPAGSAVFLCLSATLEPDGLPQSGNGHHSKR